MGKLSTAEVGYWLAEIDACEKRKRKDLMQRNNYPFLVDYYEGHPQGDKSFNEKSNAEREVFINEYFPNVNSLISDILFTAPEIMVEPRKPSAEEGAPIMRSALNYAFDRLDALTENRVSLFDMLFAGYGAIEVAHINLPEEEKVSATQVKPVAKKLFGAKSEEDAEEKFAEGTPPSEYNYATTDETYLRRWCPLDVIRDYRAERDKDERFRGKIIRLTYAEFIAMYPAFKDKVYPSGDLEYSVQPNDTDKKLVTLYELQIKRGKTDYVNVVLSPGYRISEIDYWERPYTANGFNMIIGQLHEYGKLYPISMAQINKAVNDDLNNYVSFMMETAERNIPKRAYTKGKLEEDGLSALNSNKVNANVPVKGGMDSIWNIPNTNISNENKELMSMLVNQKEKLWAVSTSRLQGKSDVKFATELEIQEAGFNSRQADIQEGLRKFISKQMDMVKDIIVQYWDQEYWFKVTDTDGNGWYQPEVSENGLVTNPLTDMLTGDYEVNINITSSARLNRFQRRKEVIEYLTWLFNPVMLQYLQSKGIEVNPETIKQSAKDFGFNPENLFIAAPPPMPMGMPGAEQGLPPEGGMPVEGEALGAVPPPAGGLPMGAQ